MAQRTRRIGKQLGAPAQQLLPEIFDLQRVHELFLIARMIVWRQHRAHSSPQTPVQNGGGVYESGSPVSTVNAAIHRVDFAEMPLEPMRPTGRAMAETPTRPVVPRLRVPPGAGTERRCKHDNF